MQSTIHPVTYGKRTRMSFSKVKEILDIPDLIEVQKKSYQHFLDVGLREAFNDISPIQDYIGALSLELVDYHLDKEPKYSVEECKIHDATWSAPMKVRVRLKNNLTGEIKEAEVFMGEFPLMTDQGTFIINGAERVIVSQLVRSPGVIFGTSVDKNGKLLANTTVIPNRGAWLEYESDSNSVLWTRVDRTRKQPATVLLRALGYGTDQEIIELLGEEEHLLATLERDTAKTKRDGLLEIYRRLRPGEPPTVESAEALLTSLFFDTRRYDLAAVGRYKINKKLSLATRITGQTLAEDVISPYTGEIVAEAGIYVDEQLAASIQQSGVRSVDIALDNHVLRVVGNQFVDAQPYLPEGVTEEELGITEKVHFPTLMSIFARYSDPAELKEALRLNVDALVPKYIYRDDIVAALSYQLGLYYGIGRRDDIDHLGNRRLRSVGELLQNQIRIGLSRLERVVKERMAIQDLDNLTPQALINIRPVTAAIKEFFGSSQLSHFMDQTNPLAELTNKRRLSALGPGGLNRDRATFDVRDVHASHYGRICPIETPEGPNIGLIGSLSIYARINKYGFIESPYRRIDPVTHCVTNEVRYMSADEEDQYIIAQANEPLDEHGRLLNDMVTVRARGEIVEVNRDRVEWMDVSPRQLVSVATAMIPFLENDAANRALMGSNMQRQAVPLLMPEAPLVGTGMEYKAALDSGALIIARENGVVEKVDATCIQVREESGELYKYNLSKFVRSNQGTCINHHPIVVSGDKVTKGDVIADGPSTDMGEISLGRNILMAFMPWEGYNYEDAVLISEKLVKEDILTSIHIEEYECESRDTKLAPEEITREVPNVGEDSLKDLNERGIVRIGAEVTAGDILVGKVTPKGETELNAEERLLRAIFGEKVREVRDTSLRVPHGESGIVVDVKVFNRENHDDLSPGVNETVRVYVAQRRKISVGDKMSGRHGNKGVISRILPEQDMPFLPDGTPLEIVLNPLGVPSRLNIGQVLEVHLGMVAKLKGWHVSSPVFDGASEDEVLNLLKEQSWGEDGKVWLRDGRSGEYFENPVTVGYMYMLKLHHLVDDKIHARSIGPYSLVTQQPLGGKAQFGGQRFGEMEVWALEAYGAAHTLQEILTVKSDDVVGRVKTYEAIVKGENVPEPGVPESFKVLIKELQSLALNVKVLNDEEKEITIPDSSIEDEVGDLSITLEGDLDLSDVFGTDTSDEDSELDDDLSLDIDLELDGLADLPGLSELGSDLPDFISTSDDNSEDPDDPDDL